MKLSILIGKTIHFLISVILILFGYLQLNDPDPFIWTGFYLFCALVPALNLFNKKSFMLYLSAAILCLICMGIYAEGAYTYYLHRHNEELMQSMSAAKPYIEEAREFLGALISLVLVSASYGLQAVQMRA